MSENRQPAPLSGKRATALARVPWQNGGWQAGQFVFFTSPLAVEHQIFAHIVSAGVRFAKQLA
jgi:hypothetical protein